MDIIHERIRVAISAAQKGIIVNAILVVVKIVTGILGNSYALIADGIESGADVLSSLIVWRGLTVAKKEPSPEYHFGYGKAETISGMIVAIMLLGAAGGVFIAAVREILTPHHLPAPFTLVVLLLVIIVKEVLFRFVKTVGEEVESQALQGDAWHHRSDAITSYAACLGICAALIGGPGWEPADDYAALLCALMIFCTGSKLLKTSLAELMDKAPDSQVIELVRKTAEQVEGVRLVEKIFMRKSGLVYLAEMHVHADPQMSLHAAHIVSGKVKTALRRALPALKSVTIHMEPAEGVQTEEQQS